MLKFLQKPLYQIIIFVTLLGGMAAWYFLESAEEKKLTQGMTAVQEVSEDYKPTQFKRNNKRYLLGSETRLKSKDTHQLGAMLKAASNPLSAQDNEREKKQLGIIQAPIKPAKLNLFTSGADKEDPLFEKYAPYGRLIPCETVITVDSSQMNTPVIGLVMEDIYHNGQLIIPAGAEVHGKASPNRVRERIDAAGDWVIVWRDHTDLNGVEMVVQGIALDMSKNFINEKWSIDDGSAGLKGYLIKSDSWEEVKLYAATFLSRFSRELRQTQSVETMFGEIAQVPLDSVKNGLLEGSSGVLNRLAQQILNEIKDHGHYVRVPAGSQFYLYVTQTLDLETAKKGNSAVKDIWAKKEKEKNEKA